MKILFSILANAGILYLMTYLLGGNSQLGAGIVVEGGWKTYILGGILLGAINVTIRPILNLLSLPLFFLFFGMTVFVVNAVILKLFSYLVTHILLIEGVKYEIDGWVNFIISVAIFTILNMVYSLIFSKK